ncbi:MAG TPA: energy transducer TonB [Candidatus Acidoferrum sp.]|nr:energy transducer TonB [Candidatus Acidoferrum sp.]
MKLLLAGGWPPLKPLPVFKYESAAYRASIEFDKVRGEWVCRKTFLPSNNVQEVRGGLEEVARSLPDIPAEAFAEPPRTQQKKQELDREASRRLQTILEWKVNFENGALYSDLQHYLSESQQQEIEEILRLTLTARQLQFSPKNVASVFDALSKAGGKLATLLEIARRNKTQEATDPTAGVELTAPSAILQPLVSNFIAETVEDSPEEQMTSVFPEQDQSSSPKVTEDFASQAPEIARPQILEANPPSFVEEHREKVNERISIADVRPQVRTRKVGPSTNRFENSASRRHVLEISGVHVAAFAVVFLFAVISLPIGLTVGRGPLGQWFQDGLQSLFGARVTPPALPDHPVETASKDPAPSSPILLTDSDNSSRTVTPDAVTPPEETPGESTQDSESPGNAPSTISNSPPATESKPFLHSDSVPVRDGLTGLIARTAPRSATSKPAPSRKAVDSAIETWKRPAPLRAAGSRGTAPRRSTPSGPSGILVSAPAHGGKPFRVSFPEKPIAATSSVAMTSELSVLVPPAPGPDAAHQSSRLQAGELVSFVWPRYARQGDRYGAAETVRVRAIVGQFGEVLDVKLLSGSAALFPATRNAIRLWRYRPTFLNKRPIPVEQDITIEFRPPQYLSQVRTQHPSHN